MNKTSSLAYIFKTHMLKKQVLQTLKGVWRDLTGVIVLPWSLNSEPLNVRWINVYKKGNY